MEQTTQGGAIRPVARPLELDEAELSTVLRRAMLAPVHAAGDDQTEQLRRLTSHFVMRLKGTNMEPQTVILQVKEILHHASRGIRVEPRHVELWRQMIHWTIGAYYRAD